MSWFVESDSDGEIEVFIPGKISISSDEEESSIFIPRQLSESVEAMPIPIISRNVLVSKMEEQPLPTPEEEIQEEPIIQPIREPTPPAECEDKPSKKKRIRKPRNQKGKGRSSTTVDPELAFLDSVIAKTAGQNVNRVPRAVWKDDLKAAEANKTKILKEKLRQAKEDRRNPKRVIHMEVIPPTSRTHPEHPQHAQPKRVHSPETLVEKSGTTKPGLSVDEMKLKIGQIILTKYQDKVIRGELTMETAVEMACLELNNDPTMLFSVQELGSNEKKTESEKAIDQAELVNMLLKPGSEGADAAQLVSLDSEFREYQLKARMRDSTKEGLLVEDASDTFMEMVKNARISVISMVDHFMEDPRYMETVVKIQEFEKIMAHSEINNQAWRSMCLVIHKRFKDKVKIAIDRPVTNPIKFYEEILKQFVAQSMINMLTDMDLSGVFEKYDPKTQPLVITSFQKHVADLFPKIELILPLDQMVKHGLAPKNASQFNPFGKEILAFGMFWSYSVTFNLYGAFFRDGSTTKPGYNYYWVVYDRLGENIDTILAPVKSITKPIVVTGSKIVQVAPGGDETSIKTTFSPTVSDITGMADLQMGSSDTLEKSMEVQHEAVMDRTFMKDLLLDVQNTFPEELTRLGVSEQIDQYITEKDLPAEGSQKLEVSQHDVAGEGLVKDPDYSFTITQVSETKNKVEISFKAGTTEEQRKAIIEAACGIGRTI